MQKYYSRKKEEIDFKYNPSNIFIKGFKCHKWYKVYEKSKSKPEETTDGTVKADKDYFPPMPPLEGDEKEAKLEPEETIAERVKF